MWCCNKLLWSRFVVSNEILNSPEASRDTYQMTFGEFTKILIKKFMAIIKLNIMKAIKIVMLFCTLLVFINDLKSQDYRDKYIGTYNCQRETNNCGEITCENVKIYISKNLSDTLFITIKDSSFLQEGLNDSQYDAEYDTLNTDRFKVYFYYTGYCQFYPINDSLLMYINGGINPPYYLFYYYYGKKINTLIAINKKDNNIEIYPNPATNKLTLNTYNFQLLPFTFQLYDIQGSLQREGKITNTQAEINVVDLPRGIYVLKIVTDKQTVTRKVVLQ